MQNLNSDIGSLRMEKHQELVSLQLWRFQTGISASKLGMRIHYFQMLLWRLTAEGYKSDANQQWLDTSHCSSCIDLSRNSMEQGSPRLWPLFSLTSASKMNVRMLLHVLDSDKSDAHCDLCLEWSLWLTWILILLLWFIIWNPAL